MLWYILFAGDIFKHIFMNENVDILIKISMEYVPSGLLIYTSTGSDNGLAANRGRAIVCPTSDLVNWRIYTSLGLNELTKDFMNIYYDRWTASKNMDKCIPVIHKNWQFNQKRKKHSTKPCDCVMGNRQIAMHEIFIY